MADRPDVRARDIDLALAATALDNAYAEGLQPSRRLLRPRRRAASRPSPK